MSLPFSKDTHSLATYGKHLTLLNSTVLKISMRSENSFWMLLRRLVSRGALGVSEKMG